MTGIVLALGHVTALAALGLGELGTAALLVLCTHAFFLWGTLRPNSQLFGPVVRSFQTPNNEVWLTIDDGVHPETTPQLLDCLARHKVPATFFVIGERANAYPQLIARILSAGHQLGNHSRTHPQTSFWAIPPWRIGREIGEQTAPYRSPVGMSNWFVHAYLRRRRTPPIGWSVRGLDGIGTPKERVVENLLHGLRPGAILAMHEGYDPVTRGYAPVDILEALLRALAKRGYRCVLPQPGSWKPHNAMPPGIRRFTAQC